MSPGLNAGLPPAQLGDQQLGNTGKLLTQSGGDEQASSFSGRGPCAASSRFVDVPVQLAASGTSVTARWYSRSSSSLQGWEVALVHADLISGEQPAPVWQSVAAPPGCTWLEATFDGLTPGGRYLVWLHARVSSPVKAYPGEEWLMVGQSSPVLIG